IYNQVNCILNNIFVCVRQCFEVTQYKNNSNNLRSLYYITTPRNFVFLLIQHFRLLRFIVNTLRHTCKQKKKEKKRKKSRTRRLRLRTYACLTSESQRLFISIK